MSSHQSISGKKLKKMYTIIKILLLTLLLGSCSSPQKLVNKALKKDPLVLSPYVEQALEGLDTSCVDLIIRPRPISPIPTKGFGGTIVDVIRTRQENRTERQANRQQGRTDRQEVRQENRTERNDNDNQTRQSNVQVRQTERTNREEIVAKEKTKRRPFLWIGLIGLAYFLGYKHKETNGKIYKKVLGWGSKLLSPIRF